jgi:hypothetical protein
MTTFLLPARLDDAWDLSGKGAVSETDAAHGKPPQISPGPATDGTSVICADGKLGRLFGLVNEGFLSHFFSSPIF